jgi:hypothetical protein
MDEPFHPVLRKSILRWVIISRIMRRLFRQARQALVGG